MKATRTNDPDGNESTDLEARDERALEEYLTVLPDAPRVEGADGLYLVVSESGSEYLVDERGGACECPDHRHRGVECKHLRRVRYAIGEYALPDEVDVDAVDPQLGEHVEADGARAIVTDGGRVVAGDEGRILKDDEDEDADECDDCAALPEGWSCATCFINGEGSIPEVGDRA